MHVIEASVSGTVRLVLVLLVIWAVLRWMQRRRMASRHGPSTTVEPDHRQPGEVRIERVRDRVSKGYRHHAQVTDADHEEVK